MNTDQKLDYIIKKLENLEKLFYEDKSEMIRPEMAASLIGIASYKTYDRKLSSLRKRGLFPGCTGSTPILYKRSEVEAVKKKIEDGVISIQYL